MRRPGILPCLEDGVGGASLKKITWEMKLSLFLIALSILIYTAKILIIGDDGTSNTVTYIFNALGFLPLNVLFVTLILNGLLSMRAKKEQQEKMKMIIGLFFSEFGSELLRLFVRCDKSNENLSAALAVSKSWTKQEYAAAQDVLENHCSRLSPEAADLAAIRSLLHEHHEFLLRLVENPVFLEQGKIAELMQALFHLNEELDGREDFAALPKSDIGHLTGDISRVYCTLASVWLSHMEYLGEHYPYLFSLSLRKSPFVKTADVIVRE